MPAGQPTKYRDEYCEQILEHMREGLSASSFAGVVGVSMDTISEWRKVHPEFSEAVKKGQGSRVLYWEKRLCAGSKNDALPIIFALKNVHPEEWRDRREIEMSGQVIAFEPSLLLAAAEVARKLQEKPQIIDVQTVEPKLIVDQTVNKEGK